MLNNKLVNDLETSIKAIRNLLGSLVEHNKKQDQIIEKLVKKIKILEEVKK